MGFRMVTILKRAVVVLFVLLTLSLAAVSASAYDYHYDDRDYQQPIYRTGYYYNTVAYGYSGWDYQRIYYKYHYPYSTGYNGGYGSYGYGYGNTYRYGNNYGNSYGYNTFAPGWTRWQYAYPVNPGYVGYPYPGYYW